MQWFISNRISIFWRIILSFHVNFSLVHLVGNRIWLIAIVFNFFLSLTLCMHLLALLEFYIMQFFTNQRKIIILRRLMKDVLPSTSCASSTYYILCCFLSCRILISTPLLVWRKSYMSIGWMSRRHLEARILIHLNSRCFSPFVSWFEIIMYKELIYWNMISIVLFIVTSRS